MKKNIAVLAGGDSSEHVVSLQSAEQVMKKLDTEKYNTFKILMKNGEWEVISDLYCGLPVNKNDFSVSENGTTIYFDCVFSAIHGTPGEDGKLQSYFDILKIPYSGCDVLTSALTFNKYFCNNFLRDSGIAVANSLMMKQNRQLSTEAITAKLELPVFVKPNQGGSSFGISKVKKTSELDTAIENAFKEADQVIIEEYIEGREITCGIFKTQTKEYIFPLTEIVSRNEFFDYESKYDSSKSQKITPADLSEAETKACQQLTSKIYDIIGCHGVVRADFILKKDTFYLLEINSIPGMTENSLVPQQIRTSGMSETELYDLLIQDALDRNTNR